MCRAKSQCWEQSYLAGGLALELGKELLDTRVVRLDADRLEDRGNVGGRGRLVAGKVEEEVSREMLHLDVGGILSEQDPRLDKERQGRSPRN